ncbi:MAG: hypothetical protein R3C53_10515 [Pirellulaceae bacterium]
MHPVDLAGLAGTLTSCCSAMTALDTLPPRAAVQQYWLTSRFRHEIWSEKLAAHRQAIQHCGVSLRSRRWHDILPVIQEVLLSEPLARCIAYHALLQEECRSSGNTSSRTNDQPGETDIAMELSSLAHRVLTDHVEARHRCLHLIVFGQGLSVENAVKLNRMRRMLEAYTDQLISILKNTSRLSEYAFHSDSVKQAQGRIGDGKLHPSLIRLHVGTMAAGLWRNLQGEIDWRTTNGRLNHQLSQAVLGLFPTVLFDGWGIPKTPRLVALAKESPETTGNLDSLLKNLPHPLSMLYADNRRLTPSSESKPRW